MCKVGNIEFSHRVVMSCLSKMKPDTNLGVQSQPAFDMRAEKPTVVIPWNSIKEVYARSETIQDTVNPWNISEVSNSYKD